MKLELLTSMRMPNQSGRLMAAMLEEAGIDPLPVLSAAGITPEVLADPKGDVSGLEEQRFQEGFAAATAGRPELWFRLGLRYRLMTYGPLALPSCPRGRSKKD